MSKHITYDSEAKDGKFPESPSVMRQFLESGVDFEWPHNVGQRSGNHCVLNDSAIPLEWKGRISDTKRASIDVFKGGSNYEFKEAFVVKTIRGSDDISSRTRAAKEVENMKDLRHPHVAALLGTYLHSSRLSILIYPAARCDLHQFFKSISKDLKALYEVKIPHSSELGHLSDESRSPVSTTSARSSFGPVTGLRGELSIHSDVEDNPLDLSVTEKIDHLRRYFVCLSQALNYIHESDVRHKDVKPANVLIDASGSVVLTDFGISRRFPKSTSHVTNDRWEMTRKYASPEIMKGKKVPRDDPSDVFSLGCVFLEMATLILKKNHDDFRAFYSNKGDAYFDNLEKVHQWIGMLEGSKQPVDTSIFDASLVEQNVESHDFIPDLDQRMMDSLATIRRMLNENPVNRPAAKGLWKDFQSLSPYVCNDCDERKETRWRPNSRQQQNTESGVSARRSQHKIHGPSEIAKNQSSRISPERLSGDHLERQQRASSSAVYQQIPSMPTHESVLQNPNIVHNRQVIQKAYVSLPGPNSSIPTQESLPPSRPIIVYDKGNKTPYITAFVSLKGKVKDQDYLSYPLPRFGQQLELGEKGQRIAKVDLSSLGVLTTVRRLIGEFPKIYVINFITKKPDSENVRI